MTLSNYKRWQNPADKIYFGTSWELRDGQLDLAVTSDKAIKLPGKTNRFGYKFISNGRNRTNWNIHYELKTLGGFDSNVEAFKAGAAGSILVSGAVGVAKNIGGILIEQVGARTDNVALQNTIDNILSVTKTGIGFAGAIAAGAAVGGPWGAVAGAVIGIANEAVSIANKAMNYSRTQAEHIQKETMASERLGITAADRNRGR